MPKFGTMSRDRLATCDPRLQEIFNEVIKHFDCSILCGHRSQTEQDDAYFSGRSKVQWPNGKHNTSPSLAVDAVPYPIDWNDWNRFYLFAGFVKGVAASKGYKIRSGLDWDNDNDVNDQTFNDAPHFELID